VNRHWQGVARVLFVAVLWAAWPSGARALTISEIMYHPGPDGVEYVEIYNEDGEARDLSHYYFSHGVAYIFPGYEEGGSVFIRGKSYLVVTKDVDALLKLYPYLQNDDPRFPAVVGPYGGSLDNNGEKVTLANPGGAVDSEVSYNNRGDWPAAADGTGHSLILKNPDLDDAGDSGNWTWSPLRGGSPGLSNGGETVYTETSLISSGATWQFFRGKTEASDPPDAWRQPAFDAGSWESGPTPLGFGATCYSGTVLTDMVGNYASVFLRKSFQVADPAGVDLLILKLSFDDGFIAYLNGAEVARKNMNNGDAYNALASGSSRCTTKTEFSIADPQSKLVSGVNVLCLQVHNQTLTSTAFGVIPELVAKKGQSIGGAPRLDVDLNELHWNTGGGDPWLEIYNDQDSEQDLSGFFLSDETARSPSSGKPESPARLDKFTFPAGTKVPPHGFLVVEQAQLVPAGISLASRTGKDLFLALSRSLPDQPPERRIQVVDCYSFKVEPSPATVGMSFGRHPDGTNNWAILRTPTKGAANQFQVERNVVLNEIMYHPFYPYQNDFVPGTNGYEKPEDQGEYVEIFNRGPAAVNISGWSLSKAVEFTFPPGTTIGAGAYFVVARDPEYIKATYGLGQDQVFGPWYKLGDDGKPGPAVLSDSGEKVELQDEIGNEAEGVHYYDRGRWSLWADTRGSSLERIDPFLDSRRAGNWDSSDESGKSEWKHFSWKGKYTETEKELQILLLTRGIVLLDNLSVTDPLNPAAGNYIKNGDFELPLSTTTWSLDGTHIHSGRITYDKKDGQACLKIISTGRGNDRIDRIRYASPAFPTGKELLVEFDAKWIAGEAVLIFTSTWNSFAHQFYMEVPRQTGTPGRENSVHARLPGGNRGPLVEKVHQTPVLPPPSVPVVVTAELTDSDGVKEVKLRYSVESVKAAVTDLPMLDDGQAPDEKAGDGIYTATVPGQALGKRVIFSILATDSLGNVGRFPLDDRQRTHPYLLDPANTDETKLRYAVYIHGAVGQNGGVPEYRILMTQENSTELTTRHVMNNDVLDSSFVWNDSRIWYNVGTRYGNSPWTRPGGKSYVMKFTREDPLQGYLKFKLDNLGNQVNERAEYYLIRSNNVQGRDAVPFGRSTYAKPFFNGGYVGNIFERVEVPGKPFVDRWWPHDAEGVLYKLDDKFLVNLPDGSRRDNRDAYIQYPPDRAGDGADPEEYRWYFMHRTREKYADFSELIDLARFFTSSQTPQAAYEAGIFQHLNVEATIRTLAVEINCDDWDTWGTTRGKNCFFYRPRVDGRWQLIGWDKDLTFGNPSNLPLVPSMFPETVRLLNSAPGKKVFYSVLSDMLARFYKADYLNQFFNEQAKDKDGKAIAGLPPNASGPAGFLTTRTGMIKTALPRAATFDLITGAPDGVAFSSQPSITVEGSGPMNLWQIVVSNPKWVDVNGDEQVLALDSNLGGLTWSGGPTRWKTAAALPLSDGANDFTFAAFTSDGTILGAEQLRVFYNVNWKQPQVTAIEPAQGPAAGGTQVVLRGAEFHQGVKVLFGAAAAAVKGLDEAAGTISVVSPAGTAGPVDVKVQNLDGQSAVVSGGFTYGGNRFNRGDVDLNGTIDLTDAIDILQYQFFGGPLACKEAADVNDDGEISLTDPIVLLNYQYQAGNPPPPPFDSTGVQVGDDPTPDPLGCAQGR
jgi:hypothetical protein